MLQNCDPERPLPFPATRNIFCLTFSAWPCQSLGFSGLPLSLLKSLLVRLHLFLLPLPQKLISLQFTRESILGHHLSLVSGILYPKFHECTQINQAPSIPDLDTKLERRFRRISELWVFPYFLSCSLWRAVWRHFHTDVNYATVFVFVNFKLITHNYNSRSDIYMYI